MAHHGEFLDDLDVIFYEQGCIKMCWGFVSRSHILDKREQVAGWTERNAEPPFVSERLTVLAVLQSGALHSVSEVNVKSLS